MSSCSCCLTSNPPDPNRCSFNTLNVTPVQPVEYSFDINAGGFLNGSYLVTLGTSLFLASSNLMHSFPLGIALPDPGDNGCASRNTVPGDAETCVAIAGQVPTAIGCSIVAYQLAFSNALNISPCCIGKLLTITGNCTTSINGVGFVLVTISTSYVAYWPSWTIPTAGIIMYLNSQPTLRVLGMPNPFIMPNSPSINKLVADYNGFPQSITANAIL